MTTIKMKMTQRDDTVFAHRYVWVEGVGGAGMVRRVMTVRPIKKASRLWSELGIEEVRI